MHLGCSALHYLPRCQKHIRTEEPFAEYEGWPYHMRCERLCRGLVCAGCGAVLEGVAAEWRSAVLALNATTCMG